MKNSTTLATKLGIVGSVMLLGLTSVHADKYWNNNTGAGSMNTAGNWITGVNGAAPTGVPGASENVYFTSNVVTDQARAVTMNADLAFASLNVRNNQTSSLAITANNNTTPNRVLSLGNGGSSTIIDVRTNSGAVTIGDASKKVNLTTQTAASGSTFTINNSSSNPLTIVNDVTVTLTGATGTGTYQTTGTGSTIFSGTLKDVGAQKLALTVGSGSNTTLSGVNAFTGATLVTGTLNANAAGALTGTAVTVNGTLNANATGAIAAGSTVAVNTGGSLVFGANNAISNSVPVSLNGGSLVLNGTTQNLGALSLSTGTNIIDLSAGGILTLNSISSWATGATLEIIGWAGTTIYEGDATHQIILAGTAAADIASHLDQITWTNVSVGGGPTYGPVGAGQISGFELTPVPEPSTIFIGLGLLALLAWSGRRTLLETGRKLVPVRA